MKKLKHFKLHILTIVFMVSMTYFLGNMAHG